MRCGTTSVDRSPGAWARTTGAALKRGLEGAGGYGGDFATVLSSLGRLNRADVVFSTVDTVGHSAHAPRARPGRTLAIRVHGDRAARAARAAPLRGAWERLYAQGARPGVRGRGVQRARGGRARADGSASAVQRYPSSSCPSGSTSRRSDRRVSHPDVDVVSVGADPHRDFELLLEGAPVACRRRASSSSRRASSRSVARRPGRATLRSSSTWRSTRCAGGSSAARVVALPVRDNSYSGATTVLLQAMALAKPIVVTRTAAIATGYGLEDGQTCDSWRRETCASFGRALTGVLSNQAACASARREGAAYGGARAHLGVATSIGSRRRFSVRRPTRALP